jgi:hypothetical protein
MDQVAVKAQVWISETRKNKTTFKYKNLIAVTSKKITETQRNEIFQAGSDELKKVFTNLLTGVIELAKSEVTLKFKNNNTPILSHIVYVNGYLSLQMNRCLKLLLIAKNNKDWSFRIIAEIVVLGSRW